MLPVGQVTTKGIDLQGAHRLHAPDEQYGSFTSSVHFAPTFVPVEKLEWLRSKNRGDVVRLRAVISSHRLFPNAEHPSLSLQLRDMKVSD